MIRILPKVVPARRLPLLALLSSCVATLSLLAQDGNTLPTLELKAAFPEIKLARPLWLEEAPDNSKRLFVVGQAGQVWLMPKDRNGKETKVFLDLVDRKPFEQNEEGLLGFAFHPQFKTNRKFYVYYTQQNPKRSVISEFHASETDPDKADVGSERILMEVAQPYWNHNGGCLSFGHDGFLYIGLGDGGNGGDPHNFGQNLRFPYAKIFRIDVDSHTDRSAYGIPKDNPFVGKKDAEVRPETWAYGLRNPWRFSFDRQTGELWAGDVGQDKWEEVDLVVKGGNYGWSDREGFHQFKERSLGKDWIDPVIEYAHTPALAKDSKFPDHSVGLSITGGYVYRGKKLPKLVGTYIYADYVSGTVWGLRYENGKLTTHGTLIKGNPTHQIASFGEDGDGEVYVLSFDGKVYELVEAAKQLETAK